MIEAIVFSTGLFSLVYQVIWQRYLTSLVGADARSSVITLTVFLSSLSLGYGIAGRVAEKFRGRELRAYGIAEAAIGGWAITFPVLFRLLLAATGRNSLTGVAADLGYAIALTAVPSVLMGLTLPLLTQGLSRSFENASRTHASIYAINTFGACAGALLSGFVLIPLWGLNTTLYLVGAANVLLGLAATRLGDARTSPPADFPLSPPALAVRRPLIFLVVAASGFLLIALESYILRIFGVATDGTVYTYTQVVAVFTGAIGLGAGIASRSIPRVGRLYPWAAAGALAGWAVVAWSFPGWPYADFVLKRECLRFFGSLAPLLGLRLLLLFAVLVIPVGLGSLLLPLSFHLLKNRETSLGRSAGKLYALSTSATVLGGVVGGHLAFAYLGFPDIFRGLLAVLFVAAIAALWAIPVAPETRIRVSIFVSLTAAISLLTGMPNLEENLALTYYFAHPSADRNSGPTSAQKGGPPSGVDPRSWLWNSYGSDRISAQFTSPEGLVSVFERRDDHGRLHRLLAINGQSNSGTDGIDFEGNALLSLLPYLLTEKPRRALVIGIGTGVTIGALAHQESVERVDVCEINQAVINSFEYFDFATFDASRNPKVKIHQVDAQRYLMRTQDKYDLVVSIPSNLWVAGMETLLTPNFYARIRNVIRPGGTFVQWIPNYAFSEAALRMITRSFVAVFEAATLWKLTAEDLLLVYSRDADPKRPWLAERLAERTFRDTMAAVTARAPEDLLKAQLGNPAQVEALARGAPPHELESPRLGAAVLRALYQLEPPFRTESGLLAPSSH